MGKTLCVIPLVVSLIGGMEVVSLIEILKGGYSLSIKCITIGKKICWVENVYGANDYKELRFVWSELSIIAQRLGVFGGGGGGEFNITSEFLGIDTSLCSSIGCFFESECCTYRSIFRN